MGCDLGIPLVAAAALCEKIFVKIASPKKKMMSLPLVVTEVVISFEMREQVWAPRLGACWDVVD